MKRTRIRPPIAQLLLVTLGLAAVPSAALGQAQTNPAILSQMSIEDLMNIEVTSASRKEQRATDVAAAIFVITQDDIRRSGMTTIPDVLRLAPGVQVAQINSNKWAVSVRGFNSLYSNKLLVLVDGRTVYTRLYSGVIWDAEGLMLDDIDRIEVIRGPGAALWGANAVNGVINILTKSAANTQGGLVRADAGRSGTQAAVRYGGAIGSGHYRAYSQWTGRDESLIAAGTRADDRSRDLTTGFRADWTTPPGALLLEGAFTVGQARALWGNLDPETFAASPVSADPSESKGGHVLARWTHTRKSGATFQIQSFADVVRRQEPIADYSRHAFDIDSQFHTAIGARHDLVAGAGLRFIGEQLNGRVGSALTPPDDHSRLVTAFFQDEIALLGKRLAVTLGSQVQHDSYAGLGVQPSVRAMWSGFSRQRIWAAASRALRTPSLVDRGILVAYPPTPTDAGLPLFLSVVGNPAAKTETLVDAEGGYRIEIAAAASIDVTAFTGRYQHLQTQEVSAPVVEFVPSPRLVVATHFGNRLEATTRGLEISGHWTPLPAWRVDASYSAFRVAARLDAGSQDPLSALTDGNAPRHQWQLGVTFTPGAHATVHFAAFHVGRLASAGVDAYTRGDITAEFRLMGRLSAMVIGQNMFQAAHAEFTGDNSLLQGTQVARSASVRLRWTFR
jgi:iron complex outermembrane recepter protein